MSSSDLATTVGRNIRRARLAAKLTQSELANQIGATSLMAVSRWETGTHKPSDAFLVRLSTALGRPLPWFFTERDEDQPTTPAKRAA